MTRRLSGLKSLNGSKRNRKSHQKTMLALQKASVATWSLVVLGACWHSGARLQLMRNCPFAFFNHDATKWEMDKLSLSPLEPMNNNFLWEWRGELTVHSPQSLSPSSGESESSRAGHRTSLTNLSLKTFAWLRDGNASSLEKATWFLVCFLSGETLRAALE